MKWGPHGLTQQRSSRPRSNTNTITTWHARCMSAQLDVLEWPQQLSVCVATTAQATERGDHRE